MKEKLLLMGAANGTHTLKVSSESMNVVSILLLWLPHPHMARTNQINFGTITQNIDVNINNIINTNINKNKNIYKCGRIYTQNNESENQTKTFTSL